MNAKALFFEVDKAVGEALSSRVSKLDQYEIEEWTDQLLREDAQHVRETIAITASNYGWTAEEYNGTYRKLRRNRHTPTNIGY